MRDRKEIEAVIDRVNAEKFREEECRTGLLLTTALYLLLDIRELLQKPPVENVKVKKEANKGCEKCIIPSSGIQTYHKIECDCECHAAAPAELPATWEQEKDPLFDEAKKFVERHGRSKYITTTGLRKLLGCAYSKADLLLRQLEDAGVVSGPMEAGRRKVL